MSIKSIPRIYNRRHRNNVRIIISGGSGFNNLINAEQRPISPDIDVKLCFIYKSN